MYLAVGDKGQDPELTERRELKQAEQAESDEDCVSYVKVPDVGIDPLA
jgi:hypothetical protein